MITSAKLTKNPLNHKTQETFPVLERQLHLNTNTHMLIYIEFTPLSSFFFFSLSISKLVLTTNFESASVLITSFNILLLGDIAPLNQCLQDWSRGEFYPISCFIMKDSYSLAHHVSTVIYINFSVLKCSTAPSDTGRINQVHQLKGSDSDRQSYFG